MREQPPGSLASLQIPVSIYYLLKGIAVLNDAVFPSFSSCYGHNSRQEDIFEADVRPLIDVVYSGAVGPFQCTYLSQMLSPW
jgi:kinesin family protein 22